MDEHYGKPLAEDENEKTMETNRALARWLEEVGRPDWRKYLKPEQKDFYEHSIMEQLRKIRFPTWFKGSTTALVFYTDHSGKHPCY